MRIPDLEPVLSFLRAPTPQAWVVAATGDIATLLRDHAMLELKAAQQAQKLIWKYAVPQAGAAARLAAPLRRRIMHSMSRLAREELRHFEQVLALLESRAIPFTAVSASRYAGALHGGIRAREPGCLVDTLIVGAIIEARSCERFYALLPALGQSDPELARFYASLLRSEARHFENYLALADLVAGGRETQRIERFLEREADLILDGDWEMRFHSGVPQRS